MAYLLPTWEVVAQDKKAFRGQAVEAGIARALGDRLVDNRVDLDVREIFPEDLGLHSWQVGSGENHRILGWIDTQVLGKIIIICKVVILSDAPFVTKILMTGGGGAVMGVHGLETLHSLLPLLRQIKEANSLDLLQAQYGLENLKMEGWFTEPYLIGNGQHFSIDLTLREKAGDERLILGGFVIKPHVTL